MNTHQLEVFYHVAMHESVTKAAESLHISQPAVSAQIRAFEYSQGVKLFEKKGRGIQLTLKGQALFELITPFFSSTLFFAKAMLEDSTQLRISGNYLMTQFVLPDILQTMPQKLKNNRYIVKSMASSDAMRDLEQDRCDVVLVSASDVIFPTQSLEVVELFEDEIVYVTRNSAVTAQDTTLIVSRSKRDVRNMASVTLPFVTELPIVEVETTQDAIANLRVNAQAASFISARFLRYYAEDFAAYQTGVKSKFYAIYKKNSPTETQVKSLVKTLSRCIVTQDNL